MKCRVGNGRSAVVSWIALRALLLPPFEHAHGTQGQPLGRLTRAGVDLEPYLTFRSPIERPSAVCKTLRAEVVDGLGKSWLGSGAGELGRGTELVQRAQYVVVPAARVMEA